MRVSESAPEATDDARGEHGLDVLEESRRGPELDPAKTKTPYVSDDNVVLQKSIPAQIRQLILYYYNNM